MTRFMFSKLYSRCGIGNGTGGGGPQGSREEFVTWLRRQDEQCEEWVDRMYLKTGRQVREKRTSVHAQHTARPGRCRDAPSCSVQTTSVFKPMHVYRAPALHRLAVWPRASHSSSPGPRCLHLYSGHTHSLHLMRWQWRVT